MAQADSIHEKIYPTTENSDRGSQGPNVYPQVQGSESRQSHNHKHRRHHRGARSAAAGRGRGQFNPDSEQIDEDSLYHRSNTFEGSKSSNGRQYHFNDDQRPRGSSRRGRKNDYWEREMRPPSFSNSSNSTSQAVENGNRSHEIGTSSLEYGAGVFSGAVGASYVVQNRDGSEVQQKKVRNSQMLNENPEVPRRVLSQNAYVRSKDSRQFNERSWDGSFGGKAFSNGNVNTNWRVVPNDRTKFGDQEYDSRPTSDSYSSSSAASKDSLPLKSRGSRVNKFNEGSCASLGDLKFGRGAYSDARRDRHGYYSSRHMDERDYVGSNVHAEQHRMNANRNKCHQGNLENVQDKKGADSKKCYDVSGDKKEKHVNSNKGSKYQASIKKFPHANSAESSVSGKKHENLSTRKASSSENDEVDSVVDKSSVKKQAGFRKFEPKLAVEDETQREMLIDQLTNSKYECMICCNVVRRDAAVWSCSNCYHIFHLYCIKRWASSSSTIVNGGSDVGQTCWRCPACQNPTSGFPNTYMCFCGKSKDPEFSQYMTPHSCGDTCSRLRSKDCPHSCTLQCHPGPCPSCQLFVTKTCLCGKTKHTVKCSNTALLRCDELCGKTLNCGLHQCTSACHEGQCQPCQLTVSQTCHCGKDSHQVLCGSQESFIKSYSCDKICSLPLACKIHNCQKACHDGPCDLCSMLPSLVTHCPCGKSRLVDIPGAKPRKSCLDEIATCQLKCQKQLICGPEEARHQCKQTCHAGECGSCDGTSEVTCRCGSNSTQMPCRELSALLGKGDEAGYHCDRRCTKKMSCGRHKCGKLCCFNADHVCRLTCGYKLSCGEHKCEEACHRGNCPPCWRVSFDELHCHCGTEVIFPPVPCGTQAPVCHRPCIRAMPCGHKVNHPCHSDPACPPCAVLTQKWCYGRHELRSNIPCYVADVSCGKPCGKSLPCQVHKCSQSCHKGPCPPCRQPCPAPRPICDHPCSLPCHSGSPCPSVPCKVEILVRCECGRREERVMCMQGSSGESRDAEYGKIAAQSVAARLWEGQSIDIGVLKKELKNRKLACTSECAVLERNQRLALALEIKNPDLSGKLGNPSFTVFLKEQAKLNPSLVASVEKVLSDIVLATQQKSKVTKKSHSFKSMPSVQRRVIHELAEFYGCQTESYDEEPNKNVVATAVKDKCWLPNVTLTAMVQRELFPKAPMPIPINHKESDLKSAAKAAKQSTQVYSDTKTNSNPSTTSKRPNGQSYVDYFDMTD